MGMWGDVETDADVISKLGSSSKIIANGLNGSRGRSTGILAMSKRSMTPEHSRASDVEQRTIINRPPTLRKLSVALGYSDWDLRRCLVR